MMACHRFVILRQIADAYHKELVYRATKMQAFYRGKRARMMTRIKMHNLRQKKLRLINNHKQCQRLCRGFSARRFTKRLRIETRKRRVKQAKSWRQVAEDPANPGIPIDPDTTLLTQDQQRIVWTSLETGETQEEEPIEEQEEGGGESASTGSYTKWDDLVSPTRGPANTLDNSPWSVSPARGPANQLT